MSSAIKLYQRHAYLSQLLSQYYSNEDQLTEEEKNEKDDIESEIEELEDQIDKHENMHDHENPY